MRFDVSGFELSWPWSPLQSVTGPGRCVPLRVQPPPMGFVPPSALAIAAAHVLGFASPERCTLRVRRPSRRLPSATTSTALFRAAHARGVLPFGAFSFARRERISRCALALLPLALRCATSAAPLARLQGLAPPGSPSHDRRVVPAGGSMLPWASTSSGVSSRPRWPLASQWPPLTSLGCEPAPQSVDRVRAGSSPPRPPPLLRFMHLVLLPVIRSRRDAGSWFHRGLR